MLTMENIKPLYIPKSKRWKGLTVFCYRCKTNVSDSCKKTGKPLSQCQHGENHVFKVYVHVNGTSNQRKTKKLETRDLNEAIIQAIAFKNEIKGKANQINKIIEKRADLKSEIISQNKPHLLVNALARYIGWLNNEGVPAHRVKIRSDEHIKDVERSFKVLVNSLNNNGYNLSSLTTEDINDEIVGHVYLHLEKRGMANRTFNKYLGYYTSFLKWYADEYNCPIRNYFERVNRKLLNPNPEAINQNEYAALLKQITKENGLKEFKNNKKPKRNLYRPWLADGIKLALETGRRREEIINLKWSNIHESEGIKFIKVEDYKVNHIQKRTTEKEKKYIYIPVTEPLLKLLNELNYDKYQKTDNYILAPDINIQRNRVMSDTLSRGFTHFYNQLNTERKLTFKSLRKAYITNLEIFMGGGNTKSITGHSENQVIEKNYIDKKEIAKAAHGFNVFPQENQRNDALKEIRNKSKGEIQEKSLEV